MTPRLPTTAAPGAATTTGVIREGGPQRGAERGAPGAPETKRLRGTGDYTVFVGLSQRPQQDESLMGPEISWCEVHCRGHWTVLYGKDHKGHGRATYFGFDDPADAEAFQSWQRDRRAHVFDNQID